MPIPGVRETAAGWVAVTKNSPPPAQPQSSQRRWFTWKKPASTPEAPVIERAAFRYDNIVEYADRAVAAIGAIAHSDCFKKGILGERNATGAILTNRLFDCLENMLKVDHFVNSCSLCYVPVMATVIHIIAYHAAPPGSRGLPNAKT